MEYVFCELYVVFGASFCPALGSLWFHLGALGSLGAPFGSLWAPFGSLWPALGLPLAPFWEPLGHICNFIKNWMSFTEKCVNFMKQ